MSVWNRGSASKALKKILSDKSNARRRDRQAHFRRKAIALEILETRRVLATEIHNYDFLQLGPSDRTLIEIGGPQAGNPVGGNDIDGYDRLQVATTATVDGTLQVALVNDYVPDVGTEFQFLTAGGAISGSFDQLG